MKKGSPEPPTYFWAGLLPAIGLHFVAPVVQLIHTPYRYAAALLLGVGLWLNVWADGLFKREKTTVKPSEKSTHMIVGGPFRISRHPMYLGMVLALLGVAIMLGSLIAFLPALVFFLIMRIAFIPYEERDMEDTFGAQYREYKARVRRWV
jgi:protein-S-isoprenylcysteine O-methyltransferase Ste14